MTLQTTQEINSLHLEFQTYGRNAKEWIRKCQLLLPQIRDEEVWLKKGFGSIYEYAAKLAGMSHNSVNEALRVLDQVKDKPKLKEKIEQYGINRVKPILTIATENTQEFWAGKIDKMAQKTLEVYVREYKKKMYEDGLRAEGQRAGVQGENLSSKTDGDTSIEIGAKAKIQKVSMYMKLDVETIEKLKQIQGDRDWNELMKDLVDNKLEVDNAAEGCDSGSAGVDNGGCSNAKDEKPQPVNTGKPYVPAKIRKYVIAKTSGCCAYPGCTKPYEILHHTGRFALDSTHDPDTLVPLCKAHERIAHSGLIAGEEEMPVEMTEKGGENVVEIGNGKGNDEDGVNRSDDGYKGDSSEGIKINWCVKKQPDTNSRKYEIDQKVNQYYMPST